MPRTILVVDDEQNIVRMLEMNLARQGYNVVTAYDGAEALATARNERPDLVLMDVNMPNMDGYAALAAMKADSALSDVPVIMLTANRTPEDLEESLAVGAEYHITKPIEFSELLEMLDRFWRDRPESP